MREDLINEELNIVTQKRREAAQLRYDAMVAEAVSEAREEVYFDDDVSIEETDGFDDAILSEDMIEFVEEDVPVFQKNRERRQGKFPTATDFESPLVDFEMGTEHFYHQYSEPGDVKHTGLLNGVNAAYTYRLSENKHIESIGDIFKDDNKVNMIRIESMFSYGFYEFDSEDIANMGDHNRNYMLELRGLVGYDLPSWRGSRITPYLGAGYRYLNDDSAGRYLFIADNLTFEFERESRYFYIPFGVTTFSRLKKDWDMELNLEYDLFVSGVQKNHYEDGGISVTGSNGSFALDGHRYQQNGGFGLRGSAKFSKQYEGMQFLIEPFIRYWDIGESETKQFTSNSETVFWFLGGTNFTVPLNGNQPENYTLDYGVKLGLRY